jgi:phosphoribosylaminoimidazolecarboxamide formyltransferase/IMP cyclohydrolase
MKKIVRAIISVTNKEGIADFANELSTMGVEIISTGGTAKLLSDQGIKVIPISSYTGFPEMLGGRVKTLHPKIHGGILGIRDNKEHAAKMQEHGILPIDMVIVNLYAFEKTIAGGASFEDAIENIDIGGPTMIRSAAKNFNDVACVTDPADYESILEEMRANDASLGQKTRLALAKKVFQNTARYDGAISNYLGLLDDEGSKANEFPETFTTQHRKIQDLRYGENPHQKAAFYSNIPAEPNTVATAIKHQGKELSFNNILDLNAAISIVSEFTEPTVVIIKHNNPCGVALSTDGHLKAYELALQSDSKSAFGGIVGVNGTVTAELAERLTDIFLEAVIAPSFEKDAIEIFKKKKNLRVIETGAMAENTGGLEVKKVSGGILLQDLDIEDASEYKSVTERAPSDEELEDLKFAWKICKHVKSNAIIFVKDKRALGVGAGQMSRIDSTNIAIMKAKAAGLDIKGSVMASDAFFPFRDNLDLAGEHGITAIIQPGGSIKDKEVKAAADEHKIAMVFTGMRHFKH